jgi:type III pantothenate kinase
MNLVVDFGNTCVKAALFDKNQLSEHFVFANAEALLKAGLHEKPLQYCMIGSVTQEHELVYETFTKYVETHLFTRISRQPLRNLYTSAITLGSDRLAAAVGAYTYFPNQNVLTIDAGTCIKYNFVSTKNEYIGGAISPGISMRLKSMHAFTSALPAIEVDKGYRQLIGTSTRESLLSGALTAAVCEVEGMISRYKAVYPDLQVVMTGGDSDYLCSQLKSRFFADQFLILHGLHTILLYNIEK